MLVILWIVCTEKPSKSSLFFLFLHLHLVRDSLLCFIYFGIMKNDIWSNSIVNYSKYLWCAKSNMHHYHCHSVWGMRIESQIEIVGVWQFFNVSCWVDASHSCVWIEYNWALFIWCLRNPSAHHTNQQQFHLCKCCFAVIIGCNREKSLAHENCHFVELCDICMGQSLFLTIYASGKYYIQRWKITFWIFDCDTNRHNICPHTFVIFNVFTNIIT